MSRLILIWACALLYLMGALVSRSMVCIWGGFYPIYNWLMCKSVEMDDKHGLGVWDKT